MKPDVVIGNESISLISLIDVADARAKVIISDSDEFVSKMEASRSVLHKAIRRRNSCIRCDHRLRRLMRKQDRA